MLLLTAIACSDYDLQKKEEEPRPQREDTDTIPDDTTPPTDDTGTTGGGTVTDTDPPIDTGDPLVATEPVYLNTSSTLYSYDPDANSATSLGRFSCSSNMTDIAIDLDGYMYGVDGSALYSIDPRDAQCARVAAVDDYFVGLTFVSDGRLVASGDTVAFLDTSSGRATTLVRAGEYTTSGDIIGLPDGMLYWTVQGADDLVQVDPNDGSTTRVGRINVSDIFGLGYHDGTLYGFTSGGQRVVIDETNAQATDNDRLSGTWWGATTNPVLW
ncbi:MAG: hypothetical protein ACOZNI_31940 [Myxococcota bacterium]